MAKPIFMQGSDYAFDSHYEHIFKFMWSGINPQAIANTLTIRNNITNTIVYSRTQNTLLLQHRLEANSLENGILYNATISVTDIDGNVSSESNPILFYCYSTPTFNVNVDSVIQSSSCSIGVDYSQIEGEELQVFKIELYNSSKELLYTSSLKYSVGSTVQLNNLIDNTTYYVKAIGQTANHMNIESDFSMFTVNYITPSFYAYITAENRYNYGDIQFTSNLISIEGKPIEGTERYINDDYVDTVNGTAIKFEGDFTIQNNFSLVLMGYGFLNNQLIFSATNHKGTLNLYARKNEFEEFYAELNIVENEIIRGIVFSNSVSSDDMIKIIIKHKDGYFNLGIEVV